MHNINMGGNSSKGATALQQPPLRIRLDYQLKNDKNEHVRYPPGMSYSEFRAAVTEAEDAFREMPDYVNCILKEPAEYDTTSGDKDIAAADELRWFIAVFNSYIFSKNVRKFLIDINQTLYAGSSYLLDCENGYKKLLMYKVASDGYNDSILCTEIIGNIRRQYPKIRTRVVSNKYISAIKPGNAADNNVLRYNVQFLILERYFRVKYGIELNEKIFGVYPAVILKIYPR